MEKIKFDIIIKCKSNIIQLSSYSNTLIKSAYNFDNEDLFIIHDIKIEGYFEHLYYDTIQIGYYKNCKKEGNVEEYCKDGIKKN